MIIDSSCIEVDGTHALIFTGGSPVAPATGTYTILSHIITAINLTYGGVYYQSLPTVTTQSTDGTITATWVAGNYRGVWAPGTYSINAIVFIAADHRLYQSLQNANTTTPGAVGNETWWLDMGSTERWRTFDASVGSQAEFHDLITYEIDPGPIDSVAILNLEANSVTVTMTDVGGAGSPVIWTEATLIDGLFVSDIVKMDFPLTYNTPHLVIEIEYTGGTAKVGEIVVGQKESIGISKSNPSVSIIDYSVKEVDAFGNYTVLERAYSKRLSCETYVLNIELDAVYNVLADTRALPAVWVGSEDYASMIVYGFYKDFSIEIAYLKYSICTLEIEGLV
jgi:hypothetical protein